MKTLLLPGLLAATFAIITACGDDSKQKDAQIAQLQAQIAAMNQGSSPTITQTSTATVTRTVSQTVTASSTNTSSSTATNTNRE